MKSVPSFRSRLEVLAAMLPALVLAAPAAAGDDEPVTAQGIVMLEPEGDIASFNQRHDTTTLDAISDLRLYLLALPDGFDEDTFETRASADEDVRWADLNYTGRDIDPEGGTQSFFLAGFRQGYIGQDGIDLIGSDRIRHLADGSGITVAVLDSGIDRHHPTLADAVLQGWDFIDDDADPADDANGIDDDGDGTIDEMVGHGTFVAGLIRRVAPEARLLPVRIMNSDGLSTTWLLVKGLHHAAEHGADVINVSLGTTDRPQVLEYAVQRATERGAIVVAAAGNDGHRSSTRYPAGFREAGVLAVTATDDRDRLPAFSPVDEYIRLAAPGVRITSTVPRGEYGRASGTSFAAPLVAGTVALVRSLAPRAEAIDVIRLVAMTAAEIDGPGPPGGPGGGSGGGNGRDHDPEFGRLDAAAAVEAIVDGDLP